MESVNVLQKGIRQIILGAIGFGCSILCIMGYYPVIPAYFAANYLRGEGGLLLYVGLLAGMGYFLSMTSMVKYGFALVAIAVTIRFYIWANRKCSGAVAGLIAGAIIAVMNISGNVFAMDDGRQLLLGLSEGVLIIGLTMAIYYCMEMTAGYIKSAERLHRQEERSPAPQERKMERVAAFATAVDGLSSAFTSMHRIKEKSVAEDVGALEQEITGKLCAACDGCAVCWNEHRMDLSVRIRQMLQAVIAHHPREEIMEKAYLSTCPRYSSMVEEAIAAFGRMELNQAWYRRLIENRIAIAGQLDAIAGLMNEWNRTDPDITGKSRTLLTKIAYETKERGLIAEDVHIYEDAQNRRYIEANVASKWGGGIPARNYVRALERATGQALRLEQGARSLLTQEPVWITVYEDTRFYTMAGIAAKKKNGSSVNGDNFTMFTMEDGRHYVCLSDGMGSGSRASQESELVVDLLQKFMEAGFGEEIAIRMMNSAMVLQGQDNAYSTLDLAKTDLYSGELELYKIGAAASFIRRGEEVEYIASGSLPAGASLELKPEIIRRQLQSGDFLVMVSDGVLEYLHTKNPEQKFAEILSDIQTDNASALAQRVLEHVLLFTGGQAPDDMTILVTGVWEK
ncbi:MAG: SpoIIE family protein phosphatase [Agathobacter sp.]|nr:SpoIIE family protein phosphatase [Agathobacter sp.]